MTADAWPDVLARLTGLLLACDRPTTFAVSPAERRILVTVQADRVRAECTTGDAQQLTAIGWQPPLAGSPWWMEVPRSGEGVAWLSQFVAYTVAEVLVLGPQQVDWQTVPHLRDDDVDGLLTEAADSADLAAYLAIVTAGQVCVPLLGEPRAGEPFPWAVVNGADRTDLLPVFTSAEHLTAFGGEDLLFVAVPFTDLLTDWPDDDWGLMIDPRKPWSLALAPPAFAELRASARPAFAELRASVRPAAVMGG